jgi:hypothetical protein
MKITVSTVFLEVLIAIYMKQAITIIIVLAVIVGIYFAVSGGSQQVAGEPIQGNLALSITDAAANMDNIESINLTIDEARLKQETGAWNDVSIDNKTFDLLELRDQNRLALLGSANVDSGVYNQVRLNVASISVVTSDDGEQDARIPSSQLTMEGNVEVGATSTTNVTLDFVADRSLHVTEDGTYVFAPVIKMSAQKNAIVRANNEGSVQVEGGATTTSKTVSMGADGRLKAGLQIPEQAAVEVNADGTLTVTPRGKGQGQDARPEPATEVETGAGASGEVRTGQGRGQRGNNEARGQGSASASASATSGTSSRSGNSETEASTDTEADTEAGVNY